MSQAKDKRYGIAKQTTWGTAVNDTAAFVELEVDHFRINRGINEREDAGAHGTRNELYANYIHDTKGSKPSFTIAGPVRRSDLPLFTYGKVQQVTESATAPYKKTFTFRTTQPNFASSQGAFFTVIERDPTASRSVKAVDCIIEKLTLTCEAGDRLRYSADFVGRGAATVTANPSGTWTLGANNFFYFEDLARATVNWGAGAQNVTLKSFEVQLVETATPFGHNSGNFQSFEIGQRKHEFSLSILKDAQVQTAGTNLSGDTGFTVNIAWGGTTAGNTDGDLDLTFTGKLSDVEHDNDESLYGANLTGRILGATAGANPITVVIADNTDRAW